MGNLLASLRTAANSMKAFEKALAVVQNNVTNASTPGYAKQQVDFVALRFQPELGIAGGVAAGGLVSGRDRFSEQSVQRQAGQLGSRSALAAALSEVEPVFDIASGSGIAAALDDFYASFSSLSVTPNSIPAREAVIRSARDLAGTFQFTAATLARSGDNARQEISGVLREISRIGADIRDLNVEIRKDYRNRSDAGLEARMYSALEELSRLVDFTALKQEDGTYTVLAGGQIPLVIGDRRFDLTADMSSEQVVVRDFDGRDVTATIQQGRLAGMLDFVNRRLSSYKEDLDRLASGLADRVNGLLAGGVDLNGVPPTVDLFDYEAAAGAASTLQVTGIQPEQIAAALPGAPGGNGNALLLAGLATSPEIDGSTFMEFFGGLSGRVGADIRAAQDDERTASLLLSQARNLRDQVSAVDLNEEAATMVEYQRAYEASARLIRVIDELTDTMMGILR